MERPSIAPSLGKENSTNTNDDTISLGGSFQKDQLDFLLTSSSSQNAEDATIGSTMSQQEPSDSLLPTAARSSPSMKPSGVPRAASSPSLRSRVSASPGSLRKLSEGLKASKLNKKRSSTDASRRRSSILPKSSRLSMNESRDISNPFSVLPLARSAVEKPQETAKQEEVKQDDKNVDENAADLSTETASLDDLADLFRPSQESPSSPSHADEDVAISIPLGQETPNSQKSGSRAPMGDTTTKTPQAFQDIIARKSADDLSPLSAISLHPLQSKDKSPQSPQAMDIPSKQPDPVPTSIRLSQDETTKKHEEPGRELDSSIISIGSLLRPSQESSKLVLPASEVKDSTEDVNKSESDGDITKNTARSSDLSQPSKTISSFGSVLRKPESNQDDSFGDETMSSSGFRELFGGSSSPSADSTPPTKASDKKETKVASLKSVPSSPPLFLPSSSSKNSPEQSEDETADLTDLDFLLGLTNAKKTRSSSTSRSSGTLSLSAINENKSNSTMKDDTVHDEKEESIESTTSKDVAGVGGVEKILTHTMDVQMEASSYCSEKERTSPLNPESRSEEIGKNAIAEGSSQTEQITLSLDEAMAKTTAAAPLEMHDKVDDGADSQSPQSKEIEESSKPSGAIFAEAFGNDDSHFSNLASPGSVKSKNDSILNKDVEQLTNEIPSSRHESAKDGQNKSTMPFGEAFGADDSQFSNLASPMDTSNEDTFDGNPLQAAQFSTPTGKRKRVLVTSANRLRSSNQKSRQNMFVSPRLKLNSASKPQTNRLQGILSSRKKRKPLFSMTKSNPRSVAFGSPEAAEYRIGSPSVSLTPMPQSRAKALYGLRNGAVEKQNSPYILPPVDAEKIANNERSTNQDEVTIEIEANLDLLVNNMKDSAALSPIASNAESDVASVMDPNLLGVNDSIMESPPNTDLSKSLARAGNEHTVELEIGIDDLLAQASRPQTPSDTPSPAHDEENESQPNDRSMDQEMVESYGDGDSDEILSSHDDADMDTSVLSTLPTEESGQLEGKRILADPTVELEIDMTNLLSATFGLPQKPDGGNLPTMEESTGADLDNRADDQSCHSPSKESHDSMEESSDVGSFTAGLNVRIPGQSSISESNNGTEVAELEQDMTTLVKTTVANGDDHPSVNGNAALLEATTTPPNNNDAELENDMTTLLKAAAPKNDGVEMTKRAGTSGATESDPTEMELEEDMTTLLKQSTVPTSADTKAAEGTIPPAETENSDESALELEEDMTALLKTTIHRPVPVPTAAELEDSMISPSKQSEIKTAGGGDRGVQQVQHSPSPIVGRTGMSMDADESDVFEQSVDKPPMDSSFGASPIPMNMSVIESAMQEPSFEAAAPVQRDGRRSSSAQHLPPKSHLSLAPAQDMWKDRSLHDFKVDPDIFPVATQESQDEFVEIEEQEPTEVPSAKVTSDEIFESVKVFSNNSFNVFASRTTDSVVRLGLSSHELGNGVVTGSILQFVDAMCSEIEARTDSDGDVENSFQAWRKLEPDLYASLVKHTSSTMPTDEKRGFESIGGLISKQIEHEWREWLSSVLEFLTAQIPVEAMNEDLIKDTAVLHSASDTINAMKNMITRMGQKLTHRARRKSLARRNVVVSSLEEAIDDLEAEIEEAKEKLNAKKNEHSALSEQLKAAAQEHSLRIKYSTNLSKVASSHESFQSLRGMNTWSPLSVDGGIFSFLYHGPTQKHSVQLDFDSSKSKVCMAIPPGRSERFGRTGRYYLPISRDLLDLRSSELPLVIGNTSKVSFPEMRSIMTWTSRYLTRLEMVAAEVEKLGVRYGVRIVHKVDMQTFILAVSFLSTKGELEATISLQKNYPSQPVAIDLKALKGEFNVDAIHRRVLKGSCLGFGGILRACDILAATIQ